MASPILAGSSAREEADDTFSERKPLCCRVCRRRLLRLALANNQSPSPSLLAINGAIRGVRVARNLFRTIGYYGAAWRKREAHRFVLSEECRGYSSRRRTSYMQPIARRETLLVLVRTLRRKTVCPGTIFEDRA